MIIKLAEKRIRVDCLYDWTEKYCEGYLEDPGAEYDFSVRITTEDICFERDKNEKEEKKAGVPQQNSSDEYLESLAVYRKIAEIMPDYDTFLFHGSAIAVDGEGYLFTAKSGTGKSTHTRLWRELFGERAVMVNDDKPLIRLTDGIALVYGTPWNGKHRLSSNIAVPLKAVCVLERAGNNSIRKVTAGEVYPMLIQQSYRPAGPAALAKTLSLLERLKDSAGFYRLGCNMEPEAAKVAYEGMNANA